MCQVPIHRNCIEKVHRNDLEFSPVKITSKKYIEITSIFRPLKLHRARHVEVTSNSRLSNLHRESSSKRRGNLSIFFYEHFNVITTSNRRQLNLLCVSGTQLFIVPPIVIRLELFESQRPGNPIKPALKSSEKVTINQPVTGGTGQT